MGRAARALGVPRKKPLHAPRGFTEGGQFIGKSSILHAIIKMLSGGGIRQQTPSVMKPGSRTADPRMAWKRPRLLAHARKRGVKVRRGQPTKSIVGALRADSAGAKSPYTSSLASPAPAKAMRGSRPVAAARQADRLEARWADIGEMHGIDAFKFLRGQKPEVIDVLARRRGVKPQPTAWAPQVDERGRLVWALVLNAGQANQQRHLAAGRPIRLRGAGDVPPSIRALAGTHKSGPRAASAPAVAKKAAPAFDGETKYHRAGQEPAIARIRAGIASGEKPGGRTMLAQGAVGRTELVEFNDGSKAVVKVGLHGWGGHSPEDQADSEQLAAMVGRAFGVPVPAVYRHTDTEIYMEFVEGKRADTHFRIGVGDPPPRHVLESHDGLMMGLLDLLVGNHDRHNQNWMVGQGGDLDIHGIDHGLAWMVVRRGQDPAEAQHMTHGFVARFTRSGGWGGKWTDNDLSPGQVADIRAKLEALRPDFERLGRGKWLDFSLARLDAIGQHATRNPPAERAAHLLGKWAQLREMSVADQLRVLRAQPPEVLQIVARARGVDPTLDRPALIEALHWSPGQTFVPRRRTPARLPGERGPKVSAATLQRELQEPLSVMVRRLPPARLTQSQAPVAPPAGAPRIVGQNPGAPFSPRAAMSARRAALFGAPVRLVRKRAAPKRLPKGVGTITGARDARNLVDVRKQRGSDTAAMAVLASQPNKVLIEMLVRDGVPRWRMPDRPTKKYLVERLARRLGLPA